MYPLLAANPLIEVWHGMLDLIGSGLAAIHSVFEPVFGAHAWGWAIIGLTVIIRVFLLPLAIKQTRSMRAMQALQPQMAKIKQKYKTDRDLMKSDPDKYKQRKQKQQEEMMALYRDQGVNPAAGCLPLLLQAPIFFALFRVLQSPDATAISGDIADAPFYVFETLSVATNQAGVWGWALVIMMAGTMFWTQRQMLARRSDADDSQTQQQKIMMYGMPVFLGFIAQSLPVGVLLYWVTTNFWQMGQQGIIIHEVEGHPEEDEGATTTKRAGARRRKPDPSDNGQVDPDAKPGRGRGKGGGTPRTSPPKSSPEDSESGGARPQQRHDHLPRRPNRGKN